MLYIYVDGRCQFVQPYHMIYVKHTVYISIYSLSSAHHFKRQPTNFFVALRAELNRAAPDCLSVMQCSAWQLKSGMKVKTSADMNGRILVKWFFTYCVDIESFWMEGYAICSPFSSVKLCPECNKNKLGSCLKGLAELSE